MQYIVYEKDISQPVFMAIDTQTLKMASLDNTQARSKAQSTATDTCVSLYQFRNWNNYSNGDAKVRKKV